MSKTFGTLIVERRVVGSKTLNVRMTYYICAMRFSFSLPLTRTTVHNKSVTRFSRRPRWHQQKDCSRPRNRALLVLKCHYKNPRARISTAMPNRSSASRCSPAARPYATGTGKSSKRRHFRRGRMRPQLGEYSQIGGGSVRPSKLSGVFVPVVW